MLAIIAVGCVDQPPDVEIMPPDAPGNWSRATTVEINIPEPPFVFPDDCATADLCTDPNPFRCIPPGVCIVLACADGPRHYCKPPQ